MDEQDGQQEIKKIYDLDPLSALDNKTLRRVDHVKFALQDAKDIVHELVLVDEDNQRPYGFLPEIQNEVLACLEEVDGILAGMILLRITTGQERLSNLLHRAIQLLPKDSEDAIELGMVLGMCATEGATIQGQELGFTASYRRECQQAGISGPSNHTERIRRPSNPLE